MVKEYTELKSMFELFKKEKMKNRKRFDLEFLEDYLKNRAGGVSAYEKAGGYQGLYSLLKNKEKEGNVIPIKNSSFNKRTPPLKTRWQLVKKSQKGWEDEVILQLSRRLNLNYFLKRPELQTRELQEKLERINQFLKKKDKRKWASREERSLELFYDEKFLNKAEGKRFINRLKLSLADLKAKKYSQMFVYWNNEDHDIENILILENHSAFMACKHAIEKGVSIYSFNPDTLIFGEGKHILKSLEFLKEITEVNRVEIKYAGDLDPEGLFIFVKLKENFPDLSLKLHLEYYKQMLISDSDYFLNCSQNKNKDILRQFIKNIGKRKIKKEIKKLWKNDIRIPQEVITYEKLLLFQN